MKIRTTFRYTALAATSLICLAILPGLTAQDSPQDSPTEPSTAEAVETEVEDPMDSLARAAESFVQAFNQKDAIAIAALFSPLGEIVWKDGETLSGRQAIEDYYRDLFDGEKVPQIALEASAVHSIAPGIAVEEGMLHLTLAADEPVRSIRYTVTHAQQADGSWLMASCRSLSEVTAPSEQIKPLHWLTGEWTLESQDGVRIDMVINLDDSENFLLGEALVTDAIGDAQTVNLRIGWNPATSSVYWWTFDSAGGNSSGPWSRRGDQWVFLTNGITADAEATVSSQTLVNEGDTMVWTSTKRMLAGEACPDLTYRFVRRAPDPLSQLTPEPTPAAEGE